MNRAREVLAGARCQGCRDTGWWERKPPGKPMECVPCDDDECIERRSIIRAALEEMAEAHPHLRKAMGLA